MHALHQRQRIAVIIPLSLLLLLVGVVGLGHLQEYVATRMRRVGLGEVLAAMLGTGMVLFVIVPIILGLAIQQGAIEPPQLDVRLGGLHLVGYTTHTPDCDRYVTPCQDELMKAPAQDFYVIWAMTRTGQLAPADEWQTGTRLLTLPLRN